MNRLKKHETEWNEETHRLSAAGLALVVALGMANVKRNGESEE